MISHLYIHIPFCLRKCPYCAFFSQEPSGDDLERYRQFLKQELAIRAQTVTASTGLDSIYFGGGTPSLLKPYQIGDLLRHAADLFGLAPHAEITLEANPGSVNRQTLTEFRSAGINRLSLGVQSFDDRMLTTLGRIHTSHQAREAYTAARRAGFDNIGIDLMHSLPDQTLDMWCGELEQAAGLAPEHLSVYGLTIEEETPFATRYPEHCSQLPDQDLSADMFEAADDLLTSHGYGHYEIANYALPGRRSVHNTGYWLRHGYLGLGAGAHSFFRNTEFGTRSSNTGNLQAYAEALQHGALISEDVSALTREDALSEQMFLGLRMAEGVSFKNFRNTFGEELKKLFGSQLTDLISKGLLNENTTGIRLTRRGMLLSNQVFQQFLP